MTVCPISGNPLTDTSILDPHAYATAEQMSSDKAAYLFQCAQRSHVTYLEHQPLVLTTLLISGLKFPLLASGSALIWCAGRIIYARGYVDPAKGAGEGQVEGDFWVSWGVVVACFVGFDCWDGGHGVLVL